MAAKSKEEIQALVNEFLGKPVAPQVTEKDREDQCLALLDRLLGMGDETLIGFLYDIAQGTTGRDVLKGDRLITTYPNSNERIAAARLLRVWHRGLTARSVKVEQSVTVRHKWDPNKLPLEDLQALERMHERAALPSGQTVEGELVPAKPAIQENSENLENTESEE